MARVATVPLLAMAICLLRTSTGRLLADTAWDLSELAWWVCCVGQQRGASLVSIDAAGRQCGLLLTDAAVGVVCRQPENKGVYLGTPSLLPLSNGTLLASHDYFGWGEVIPCRNFGTPERI